MTSRMATEGLHPVTHTGRSNKREHRLLPCQCGEIAGSLAFCDGRFAMGVFVVHFLGPSWFLLAQCMRWSRCCSWIPEDLVSCFRSRFSKLRTVVRSATKTQTQKALLCVPQDSDSRFEASFERVRGATLSGVDDNLAPDSLESVVPFGVGSGGFFGARTPRTNPISPRRAAISAHDFPRRWAQVHWEGFTLGTLGPYLSRSLWLC